MGLDLCNSFLILSSEVEMKLIYDILRWFNLKLTVKYTMYVTFYQMLTLGSEVYTLI